MEQKKKNRSQMVTGHYSPVARIVRIRVQDVVRMHISLTGRRLGLPLECTLILN